MHIPQSIKFCMPVLVRHALLRCPVELLRHSFGAQPTTSSCVSAGYCTGDGCPARRLYLSRPFNSQWDRTKRNSSGKHVFHAFSFIDLLNRALTADGFILVFPTPTQAALPRWLSRPPRYAHGFSP